MRTAFYTVTENFWRTALFIVILPLGAIGLGLLSALVPGDLYFIIVAGILFTGVVLIFPSSPFTVLYPVTWVWWAYSFPFVGAPERPIAFLGILGAVILLARKRNTAFSVPFPVIVGVFILLGSYLFSWALNPGLGNSQEYVTSLAARIAFLFLTIIHFQTEKQIRLAVILIVIISILAAGLTVGASLMYGWGFQRTDQLAAVRSGFGSFWMSAIGSSGFITVGGLFLLTWYPMARTRRQKLALATTTLFLFGMAFASQFRREILITVPIVLLVLILDRVSGLRKPAFHLLVVSVLLFVFVILPSSTVLQDRLNNETQFVLDGTELRIVSGTAGLEAFFKNPMGYGPGSYSQAIAMIIGPNQTKSAYSPFNVFINLAVEAGILGLVGVVVILVGVYQEVRNTRRAGLGNRSSVLDIAPVQLLQIVIWFTFGNAWGLSLPWFLMGLILASARLAQKSSRIQNELYQS